MGKAGRTVALGSDGFASIRERGYFYVDKTRFIGDWWAAGDKVTLITRPRRFGKTLMLDTVDCYLSTLGRNARGLFEGLYAASDARVLAEMGSRPTVFLTFADVKEGTYAGARKSINLAIMQEFRRHKPELDLAGLGSEAVALYEQATPDMDDATAARSVKALCELLHGRYGKGVVVLLDEYDAPFQEAWRSGYWDEMMSFTRSLFNSTFKTNPFLERGLVTGVTCVAQESIFSDLNNPCVITTTTPMYEDCFGFTEQEVLSAMDEMGLADKTGVQDWYDGFRFGGMAGIYNPWSVTSYLKFGIFDAYWANTSRNALASDSVRTGSSDLKADFEELLAGRTVTRPVDQRVSFQQIGRVDSATWGLLLASGYLKVVSSEAVGKSGNKAVCELALTNREVKGMFDDAVREWFADGAVSYNGFVSALLAGDLREMNAYMSRVACDTFSSFDSGAHPAEGEPERFWHGFVLGLLVDLRGRYSITSNRESGFGRYDVCLEPIDPSHDDAVIIEFKVIDPGRGEKSLEDTVAAAKRQIGERRYAQDLIARGIPEDRIRTYGFAFRGKRVLIG